MIVRCQICKRETDDYRFRPIHGDSKPVCKSCWNTMSIVADIHKERIETIFSDNDQSSLGNWVK